MSSKKKNTKFTIQSRVVLVLVVTIAAFLAAFLGQILITSLNTRPSLDLSQPFIITDNATTEELSKAALLSLEKTETPSHVAIYTASPDLEQVSEGIVLTNDGWVVATVTEEQEPTLWDYIRFNSGELLPIVEVIADPYIELVYLQVESSNLTAGTLTRVNELDTFDTVLITDFNGISGRSEYLGKTKRFDTEFDADKQNTFYKLSGSYSSGAVYNLQSELIGLIIPSESATNSLMVHTLSIRSRLDVLLRTGELTHAQLGVTYIDLAHTPVLDQPSSGALITTLETTIASDQLRLDDLIVSVDGILLNHETTLSDLLESKQSEDTVDIGIIRRGEPITIDITLN